MLLLLMILTLRCCLIQCQSHGICEGYFNDASGYLTSPNYPINYPNYADCYYFITVPAGYAMISISNFSTESYADYLKIYNGGDVSAPLLHTLSGNVLARTVESTSNKLTLYFHTDGFYVSSGFLAFYTLTYTGMCGGNVSNSFGYFTSPNYPSYYADNADCYYNITVPAGYARISITNFSTETNLDYLKIYNGGSVSAPLLQTLSGSGPVTTVQGTSNKLTLHFHSDRSVTYSGFLAFFTSTSKVNGIWGSWSSWSTCLRSCENGIQSRTRACSNPLPLNGGSYCTGNSSETKPCKIELCPVNGNWGSWSSWNTCSSLCGYGTADRTRVCNNPVPSNGGLNCIGNSAESKSCQTVSCPVNGNWGSWTSWSACVCGAATRKRACDNPSPSYGGLSCPGNSTETGPCKTDPCLGDLRLRDGPFVSKGRLEIFYNSQWGTVCVDSFDDKDAIVACRQLGYSTGFMVKGTFIVDGSGPIWLDNLECNGTEYMLSTCKNSGWGVHNCGHQEDIGVECFNSLDTGALRIIEERFPNQGRLEVYHYKNTNGNWGTICDDDFDDVDALVACRQMGYSTGVTIGNNVIDGSGTILLDDVQCTGTETKLSSCGHRGMGVSNCTHSDDVGVHCFVEKKEEQTTCCASGVVAGIAISCIVLTIVCIVAVVFVRKRLLTSDKEMKTPDTYEDVRAAQAPVFDNLAYTGKDVKTYY